MNNPTMNPEWDRRAAGITSSPVFDAGPYADADLASEEAFRARLARDADLERQAAALGAAIKVTSRFEELPPDMRALFLKAEAAAKTPAGPLAYSEDQERDKDGKFGSGGGGGSKEKAAPKDPGDRPARPDKGFKNDKAIADHASKMVEAHEADPHVQGLKAAHDEAKGKAEAAQTRVAAAPDLKAAQAAGKDHDEARARQEKAREALAHEARRSFHLSFGVPHDQQADIKVGGDFSRHLATARGDTFNTAKEFLGRVSTKEAIGDQKVYLDHAKGGRAEYVPGNIGTVKLGKGDAPEIAAHEFGHHLEEKDSIRERVQAFAKERFGNEKPVDLAKVAPMNGFKPGQEFGRKDDLEKALGSKDAAYYAGKEYPGGRGEVLSMGLEQLYRDPVHFAKADPGYFRMVTSVLQGGGKK